MQDPSFGVHQSLQGHVHLISGHRFPLLPQLGVEQAFRYLLDAPTIVKQTAPMAWSYVAAPQDGTVWLEWISPRNEFRFASDGYVWGDPETSGHYNIGGYTIEVLKHNVGFRPGMDTQVATHARTRYHFSNKNPNVNAAPPDTHLWIVHYHQTDQTHMMPVPNLQITTHTRQELQERKWLESQGRLDRKDFMLHDREHWPQLNPPNMGQQQQQGAYGNPIMQQHQQMTQQRYPQYAYQQGGAPPAKRPRHSGPSGMPGAADGVPDTSIEDEENTSLGDFFDHLSPREISMMRYMQHHKWMEEVFSSPYASSQIVPPDLGLGLMGELKGLTDGILEPPTADEVGKATEKPPPAKEAQPFTNLKKDQVDEFNKRVEKHLEAGRAEIESMKKAHAEKMAEWTKTKMLMQAEKRLRQATWEGHEDAVPAYRLDVPSTNGHAEEKASNETVDDVVKNVESAIGKKITSHKESTMVEKGGLDEEQQREDPEPIQQDTDKEMSGMQQQQQDDFTSEPPKPDAPAQPTYNHQVPPSLADAAETINPGAGIQQAAYDLGAQQGNDMGGEAGDGEMDQSALDDMVDMGDTSMMEGMDMDVDTGDIDFIEHDEASGAPSASADISAPPQDAPVPADVAAVAVDTEGTQSPVTLGQTGVEEVPASLPTDQALPTTNAPALDASAAEAVSIPTESAVADLGENDPGVEGTVDNTLFDDGTFDDLTNAEAEASRLEGSVIGGDGLDDNGLGGGDGIGGDDGTFDDLTNMDGGAGDDGLIDFDGGMGMEDSAFGDAMHGMDTNTPREGDGN